MQNNAAIISGGGKCNITNENISFKKDLLKYYLGDKNFINQIISKLNYLEVLEFFKPLKFEKVKNSQFFCKTGSKSVLNYLKSKITNPKIYLNTEVFDVVKNDDIFKIYTNNGNLECKNLIVASGGLSYLVTFHEKYKKYSHSLPFYFPHQIAI